MQCEETLSKRMRRICPLVCYMRSQGTVTQRELADIMGISTYSVRLLERGCLPPRLSEEAVDRLYEEFGFTF